VYAQRDVPFSFPLSKESEKNIDMFFEFFWEVKILVKNPVLVVCPYRPLSVALFVLFSE